MNIKIVNSVLKKCEASSGGGIMITLLPDSDIVPVLENIKIENSIADIGPGIRLL